MCFTVEIDDKHFPDVYNFIGELNTSDILYMSNEYDISGYNDGGHCYRFEFDDVSIANVSRILAELIKNDYLSKYADNIIDINYCGVDDVDKNALISSILEYSDIHELNSLIYTFIHENMHIHLGGFVLFRMKDYLSNFEDEIDFAVDEYIEQRRYRDFVKFLKFFVDIQDSSFDEINVLIGSNGNYKLLDNNGIPIDKELLDSTYCEIAALDDDDGYIMLNDLISLAPKHITIHCRKTDEDEEPIKIIKEIFVGRVNICHNCTICC